jgi:hypothetical protein
MIKIILSVVSNLLESNHTVRTLWSLNLIQEEIPLMQEIVNHTITELFGIDIGP